MYGRVIFEDKHEELDGDIVEIRIWEVKPDWQHPEGVRYVLVYVQNGQRLIGYDNFHGKGHHRHVCEREENYGFTDEWTLLEDFMTDVEKIKRGVIK